MGAGERLKQKFASLFPYLNERQRRVAAASEALSLGRGGISRVARAAGLSRPTIYKGLEELSNPEVPLERVRKPGGGRKSIHQRDPAMVTELERLVDPATRGDPLSPLRWTCQSTRQLAQALSDAGHAVSYPVVAETLHQLGYSLQANVKTKEASSRHPDRDAQFQYINHQVLAFLDRGLPVISVDTKKKELVGEYRNAGAEWQPRGQPEQVQVHDFPDPRLGKTIPYGIYDVGRNLGWVNVGWDHDTASFAVSSIRRWWLDMGMELYPNASELLICADGGGSNGYRVRLWKVELQTMADQLGLTITVSHLPPGTSKWNKIEHRLFSHISMNWRGRPLTSHEVIVDLIGNTTTTKGLRVKAALDKNTYQTKVHVSDEQLASVAIRRHDFHGDWNYTIQPRQR
jgi:hypothetical protein